jgi:hypothetical protein
VIRSGTDIRIIGRLLRAVNLPRLTPAALHEQPRGRSVAGTDSAPV